VNAVDECENRPGTSTGDEAAGPGEEVEHQALNTLRTGGFREGGVARGGQARQKRFDEAAELLRRAVAIQERVFGKAHPRVASAVNDLGSVALQRGDLDEAEAAFTRMADVYQSVYGAKHYLIGIAISNLASVYVARQEFTRAEPLYRQAIALYEETQSPQHMNTGIGRIKLGRALVGQARYDEAEVEILAGYEILTKQTSPSVSWLRSAREDLVKLYTASNQPDKAKRFEAELRQ